MPIKKYFGRMFRMLFLTLLILQGCAFFDNYAKIWIATGQYGAEVQDLIAHWQDYNISYAGLSVKSPSAILFDTKIDGRSITYEKWVPVTDEQTLLTIVKWLDADVNYPPYLYKITWHDELFGYIYTSAMEQVVMKKIDENTLFAEDIPLPPMDYGPGGRS